MQQIEPKNSLDMNIYEKQLPRKWSMFMAISNLFNPSVKNSVIENPENKALTKQAQIFLETKNFEAYYKMVANGYTPNNNQKKVAEKHVSYLISAEYNSSLRGNNYKELERLVRSGLELTQQHISLMIQSNDGHVISKKVLKRHETVIEIWGINFSLLTDEFRSIVQRKGFSINFFNEMNNTLKGSKKGINNRFKPFLIILEGNPSILLKEIDVSQFMVFNQNIQKNKHLASSFREILNDVVNSYYSQDMEKLANRTKNNYSGQLINELTIEKINLESKANNITRLPEKALNIVTEIEETYSKIAQNNNSLSPDVSQTLTILFEKRLPEVLKKYLTIDESYRQTLVNTDGKNAQELMMDSLNNIKKQFDNVWQQINENNLSSLSATNRYTKSI